jgi:6-pyruvoyltetrahydropterin/6-carboxytetrahydropterin synthase
MIAVSVCHNFETAHRLFGQGPGGKCWNLHGHSFRCEVEVTGEPDEHGMIVEYGAFKAALRGYVDDRLDHGAVLSTDDPLCAPLLDSGCKVLRLAHDPTVEALAAHLATVVDIQILGTLANGEHCRVSRVRVDETATNSATWTP